MMLSHKDYLKLINEKLDEALKHPFVQMIQMDERQKQLFKLAFLNGCHAMRDYYVPVVHTLENEIVQLNADINHYVELENGEST